MSLVRNHHDVISAVPFHYHFFTLLAWQCKIKPNKKTDCQARPRNPIGIRHQFHHHQFTSRGFARGGFISGLPSPLVGRVAMLESWLYRFIRFLLKHLVVQRSLDGIAQNFIRFIDFLKCQRGIGVWIFIGMEQNGHSPESLFDFGIGGRSGNSKQGVIVFHRDIKIKKIHGWIFTTLDSKIESSENN